MNFICQMDCRWWEGRNDCLMSPGAHYVTAQLLDALEEFSGFCAISSVVVGQMHLTPNSGCFSSGRMESLISDPFISLNLTCIWFPPSCCCGISHRMPSCFRTCLSFHAGIYSLGIGISGWFWGFVVDVGSTVTETHRCNSRKWEPEGGCPPPSWRGSLRVAGCQQYVSLSSRVLSCNLHKHIQCSQSFY